MYPQIAVDLKLNAGNFEQYLSAKKWQSTVETSIAQTIALGIGGTPYLFIGNERVTENVSKSELKQIIERELKK